MAPRVATVTAPTARGERTRRLLIDAATDRFARDGYRSTTVATISRDAGLGSTTVFVHFDNKEALFLAAVDLDLAAMFHEFVDRLIDLAEKGRLEQLLEPVLDIIDRHPLARRLLGGLEPDFTARVLDSEPFDDLRATVVPIVEEGQRRGAVRPDLPAAELADGLMGLVLAMAMASVQIGPAVDRAFGRGIETVLRGLLSEDPRR
jgi:AcrR family transcriptional regulator